MDYIFHHLLTLLNDVFYHLNQMHRIVVLYLVDYLNFLMIQLYLDL